jgi:hypothetical protein
MMVETKEMGLGMTTPLLGTSHDEIANSTSCS